MAINDRLLSKLAVASKVLGDAERRTAVYTLVHEDLSTASTKQFADTVEFGKKSVGVIQNEKELNRINASN